MYSPIEFLGWSLNIPSEKRIMPPWREPATVTVGEMISQSLEKPHGFEPLRRALTPGDKITIVVDDSLPHLSELIAGIMAHLQSAEVRPEDVVVLLSPPGRNQGFIDDLPDEISDITIEVHDPQNEKRHAYLATTTGGRRVYLNRSLIESDFVIVLTGRRFDPVIGMAGGVNMIFPALSNDATLQEFFGKMPVRDPLAELDTKRDADEIAWLLGTPFFVQVIEGHDGGIDEIVSGLVDSLVHGKTRQRERWEWRASQRSSLVIATAAGELGDLANALANAGRMLDGLGHIVLLAEPAAITDEAFLIVRNATTPANAVAALQQEKPDGMAAAMLWSLAARLGQIHLGPEWSNTQELFAKPITQTELQAMIDGAANVAILPDAHLWFVRAEG